VRTTIVQGKALIACYPEGIIVAAFLNSVVVMHIFIFPLVLGEAST